MNFVVLTGSFHSRSHTQAVARAVVELLQEHQCSIPQLMELPFYSMDLSGDNRPPVVTDLIDAVTACDGLIVVTPEYNHSVPAVLKNAIDWASRPAFESSLKSKPVAIITQAESPVGGARVQAHLKLIFDSTLSRMQPAHEMMITGISSKFDEQQRLTDDTTRRRLNRHLQHFVEFCRGG